MHRTHLFIVLHTGQVEPLPQSQYVKLLRGELASPDYANETVRLADWYVEVRQGRPVALHNETYSLLHFDEKGHVRKQLDSEHAWAPSHDERKVLHSLVFATAPHAA